MTVQELFTKLRLNSHNPRTISKEAFARLKKSITEFPQMLELRPVVYDENFVVLGGNMRLLSLKELVLQGFALKDEYFKSVVGMSDADKRKFIIKDNISDGAWNWEAIANEWSDLPLKEWGLVGNWAKPPDENKNYDQEYQVVVDCKDEAEQKEIYDKLTAQGIVCKVLTL